MRVDIKKRGLSPVIAVVLLMLITIVAAGIIVAFVIPFVKQSLGGGGECFDVLGDLSFDETPYNCFNSSASINLMPDQKRTGFSVRIDNENIIGFRVSLQAQGSADALDIKNGTDDSEITDKIRMLGKDFNNPLEVPKKGGVRTYVAKGVFDKAELFPILESGAKCDSAGDIKLNECEDPQVMIDLTKY